MSNPLVVEAIEDLFVPVLVYNNRKGTDETILKQFKEPSWNNPVVRYLDASGKDLIPRKDGVWSTKGTVERMVAALKASNQQVPKYLRSLLASYSQTNQQTATFAMHCYWEGEALLGGIDGVLSTRSAWKGKYEVVTLTYDPSKVDYEKLVDSAQSMDCASKVFAHSDQQLAIAKQKVGADAVALGESEKLRDAKASDQKYYLLHSPVRHLPLAEAQATKINAALKSKQPIASWLSPRQTALLKRVVAVKARDKNALAEFQYPANAAELANYSVMLKEALAKLERQD